jgi:hypothetical protein
VGWENDFEKREGPKDTKEVGRSPALINSERENDRYLRLSHVWTGRDFPVFPGYFHGGKTSSWRLQSTRPVGRVAELGSLGVARVILL